MDDYLSKPLEPAALFAVLARLTEPSIAALSPQAMPSIETNRAAILDEPPECAIAIFDTVRVATLRRALPPADLIEFVRMFLDDLGGVTNRIQKLIAVQELD
jgi:hypothetical protein